MANKTTYRLAEDCSTTDRTNDWNAMKFSPYKSLYRVHELNAQHKS